MYMTTEDYEYHDRLFNSLDNSRAHDYMELLMWECSHMTGHEEWTITVRSAREITDLGIPQNHIITREMVNAAYQQITGTHPGHGNDRKEHPLR